MYKSLQVLRTKIPLRAAGVTIKPRTRVVFIRPTDEGKVLARIQDPALPNLEGVRLISRVSAFMETSRGRPFMKPVRRRRRTSKSKSKMKSMKA